MVSVAVGIGKRRVKRAPPSGTSSTVIEPPCAATVLRTISMPRPAPAPAVPLALPEALKDQLALIVRHPWTVILHPECRRRIDSDSNDRLWPSMLKRILNNIAHCSKESVLIALDDHRRSVGNYFERAVLLNSDGSQMRNNILRDLGEIRLCMRVQMECFDPGAIQQLIDEPFKRPHLIAQSIEVWRGRQNPHVRHQH